MGVCAVRYIIVTTKLFAKIRQGTKSQGVGGKIERVKYTERYAVSPPTRHLKRHWRGWRSQEVREKKKGESLYLMLHHHH